MREQPRTDREQPSRPLGLEASKPRERADEREALRRFDALVGDAENPRIWRGID